MRARDEDNSLIQYGILLSVIEADFLIGGPSFLCTLYLLDVLAIHVCFSRGQVVNRSGVDINCRGILYLYIEDNVMTSLGKRHLK